MTITYLNRPGSTTSIGQIVAALGARRAGGDGKWIARCPVHDDRTPSLSISEGANGVALVHCHAGCTQEAVLEELKRRGLWPTAERAPRTPVAARRNGRAVSVPPRDAAPARLYRTREDALASYAFGSPNATWKYINADGQVVGVVARWDRNGDKTIRPVARVGDGWACRAMPAPCPLYNLPALAAAKRVFVVEGEKCVDAAASIGLTATTSAHGANAAGKTDWSPLAGKDVVIFPDNDAAGLKYARAVAEILSQLSPPAKCRIVAFPDLPDGGDIVDFITAREGAEPADLRRSIEAMVAATPEEREEPIDHAEPQWEPFPLDVLPEPLRRFVAETATAIGCDPAMVALPVLGVAASAIGMTQCIELKQGSWREFPIVWAMVIAPSGAIKSPAMAAAVAPIQELQTRQFKEHSTKTADYQSAFLNYEADLKAWRAAKKETRGVPPVEPKPPVLVRYVLSETTVEAVAPIHEENPRGLLVARDELSGWIGSFNQYKTRGGGDVPNWLEMFRGGVVTIDRKTGRRVIRIPRAGVSIVGTIQPGVLTRALTDEFFAAGLPARILMAAPPRRRKHWSDATVSEPTIADYARIIERLLGLDFEVNAQGDSVPVRVPLTLAARGLFIDFYNEFAGEQDREDDEDVTAAFSKIEGYAPRFALIFQLVGWANESCTRHEVDEDSMKRGIALALWFAREAKRVYAMLRATPEERENRALVELITRRGGSVTARGLMHASRLYRNNATLAESALDQLVRSGRGTWDVGSRNGAGRPTRVFRLAVGGNGNTIANFP